MYKTSVPIHINTLNEETLPRYLETVRKCKAERVFIVGPSVYEEDSMLFTNPKKLADAVSFFKDNGLETGIWVDAFGHGVALTYHSKEYVEKYTQMEGVMGDKYGYANCPLDKDFTAAYNAGIKKIAGLGPDLIMLDDDFRLGGRRYYMGCFCPLHLKEYYRRIGEEIPREKLEELIFTGGKNKYRTEYMKMMADTLEGFAKTLRKTVDEVDDTIRMGICITPINWDYSGTDPIELSKIFAGTTKPFCRIAGAPYSSDSIIKVAENSRLEVQWLRNTGVEAIAEGDVYPRPRYNVPSRKLELFDFALTADGSPGGILKYMFDYNQGHDYETGYTDRHIKNETLRNQIREIFSSKKHVGVRCFNVMHKIENWDLPKKCINSIATKLTETCRSISTDILAKNSIPTVFGESEYPVLLCGENAKYVTEKDLRNGAILDVTAAKILKDSGVDTGLVSEESCSFSREFYTDENDTIIFYDGITLDENISVKKIKCHENARVLSMFMPDKTPSAYLYENEKGMRFYVIACDMYFTSPNANYFNSYYRQSQLVKVIEWCGKKKLPAVCLKNPNLYMITSAGKDSMSVMLINDFMDEISNPTVELDGNYSEIQFVNCTGRLDGNKVYLSEIASYDFAAFEVKK